MIGHAFGKASYRSRFCGAAMTFVIAVTLAAILTPPVAAQEPKPDPAGIATGDKNNVMDAAGTPFVVSEPTDKSAPDYAEKKKAFDEYQAQLPKSPSRQSLPIGRSRPRRDEFRMDSEYRLSRAVHAGRIRTSDLRSGAKEECRSS